MHSLASLFLRLLSPYCTRTVPVGTVPTTAYQLPTVLVLPPCTVRVRVCNTRIRDGRRVGESESGNTVPSHHHHVGFASSIPSQPEGEEKTAILSCFCFWPPLLLSRESWNEPPTKQTTNDDVSSQAPRDKDKKDHPKPCHLLRQDITIAIAICVLRLRTVSTLFAAFAINSGVPGRSLPTSPASTARPSVRWRPRTVT